MSFAAITYVFNETVNLPIWVNYYGKLFGYENLFVVDRYSNDGSTDNLGAVNVIKVPRRPFDEHEKTDFMSAFHASLTSFYDAVIITDCDEILVPDVGNFSDLNDYIAKLDGDYVNAIGIDVTHMITEEPPIDLLKPILSQRRYGLFSSPECKHLLSRIPLKWLPGFHASNMPPRFDPNLFIFHLKFMDYGAAANRQKINLETKWSEDSLKKNYGFHHRHGMKQFVRDGFFGPINLLERDKTAEFTFFDEIRTMLERTVKDPDGNFRPPMDVAKKVVVIPERFSHVL